MDGMMEMVADTLVACISLTCAVESPYKPWRMLGWLFFGVYAVRVISTVMAA